MAYDVIIIGSGAGGSAVAYQLAQAGKSVLLLEKGSELPRDGSTLDVETVLARGHYLSKEPWVDRNGQPTVPEEHFNLGGKTKWYGAALLRFSPHEFEADPAHQCVAWPFPHAEYAPYYDQAEKLLGVRRFPAEPNSRDLFAGLARVDPHWRSEPMPLGLAPDILSHADEARHFDGFASVRGLKRDAEVSLLSPVRGRPNLEILTNKAVAELIPAPEDKRLIVGVRCEDGTSFKADTVVLAAGALHSPRILQTYVAGNGLAAKGLALVGRNYKSHVLTALLAFSHRRVTDVLCKTLLLLNEDFPHSSVQTLGGNLSEEIIRTQLPGFVPRWLASIIATRVYGFFLQTEDGSHPDNRIVGKTAESAFPRIDYDVARLPAARDEHRRLVRTLQRQLLRLGYVGVAKSIPVQGTAHACGTLASGNDPATSVVDAHGRVHGFANLYVADGSVLPRSSRANPALSIYAWGLRLGSHLATQVVREASHASVH